MTEEERAAEKRRKNVEYVRKWQKANPEKVRNAILQRKYGITVERYDAMLQAQGHVCAICATKCPGIGASFAVDHCHTTGKVRGLLCFHCNTGLGKFNDNPAALRNAAAYLETANGYHTP